MNWAVTGAGGMLGRDVVDVLRSSGDSVIALTRSELDVRDPSACSHAISGADAVFNCAAWTDVDGAESHEASAFAVNAVGAANVARASREHGAVMVHVSTDYVFAGNASTPYPVDAHVAPLNAYGRTKAAGEWAVRAECPRSYVVRTAWLYGEHGRSFPTTMLRLAGERDTFDVVNDQRGQPTWTRDLAVFVRSLVVENAPFGLHHGTAAGETTWFGFAQEIFRAAGLDPQRIRPTTSDRFPRPASRPSYSVLKNDVAFPRWQAGIELVVPRIRVGGAEG
ncbi:MAG: dTDP-4-dehydrorhamnose reductase [Actinomycetes bacterium]